MKYTLLSLAEKTLVSLFFFFSTTALPAQDNFRQIQYERDTARLFQVLYPKIFDLLGKNLQAAIDSLKTVQRISEKNDSLYDAALFAYFMLAERSPSLREAREYLQKADSFITAKRRQGFPLRHDFVTRVDYSWGHYYYRIGDFDEALGKFERFVQRDQSNSHNKYLACSFIGYIYSTKGDYEKAKIYFEESEKYIQKADLFSAFHVNLMFGNTFLEMEEVGLAERYLREAERLVKKLPDTEARKKTAVARTYIALSQNLRYQCRLSEAEKKLSAAEGLLENEPAYLPDLFLEWGKVLILNDKPAEAICQLQAGLEVCDRLYLGKHYKRGVLLTEIGNAFAVEGQYGQALMAVQQAMLEFVPNFSSLEFADNPTLLSLDDCHARKELLDALHLKADLLHRLSAVEKGSADRLGQSLFAYQKAIEVIQLMRNDFRADNSKHLLADLRFSIFEEAVEVAYSLYRKEKDPQYAEAAFSISEKSKALSLLESLTAEKALQFADVPPNLLERERQLSHAIAYYERKMREANDGNRPDLVESNRSELFAVNKQYDAFIDTLEKVYPNYFSLKYDLDPVEHKELSPHLRRLEAIAVEYFWGTCYIYAFNLSPDSIGMRRLSLDPEDAVVDKFQQDCAHQIQTTKSLKEYTARAHRLYQFLVEPFQTAQKRLLIVPDGKLCRIPFGNLMTADSQSNQMARFYLENQKIISYAASLTVWKENLDAPPVKSRTYLALAPVHYEKYGFGTLSHTAAHLDVLKQQMTGKSLREQDADVQHFDQAIREEYNMLLLYTHALADSNPRIYFYDSVLYLSEIYARRIRANMAVLGSCESGAGPWQRGEGVMSLGRGFSYAGVPAVATTLWPVNERETLEILTIFYANLLQGQAKDEALTNAKRYFLQTNEHSDTKPRLWAGLILMGNPEPLFEKTSGNSAIIWALAAALLLLVGGWLLRQRLSK